jgi:hypothetical protein
MDLPCEDPTASFDTYTDVVCAALDSCDEDVVLVGHSHGGLTIPVVAAQRPVRDLVFLCAYVPDIGRSLHDQLRDEPEQLNSAVYIIRDWSSTHSLGMYGPMSHSLGH